MTAPTWDDMPWVPEEAPQPRAVSDATPQKESPPNRWRGPGADGDASGETLLSVGNPNQSPVCVNHRLVDSSHDDEVETWMTRRMGTLIKRDDAALIFDALYDGLEIDQVVEELHALRERLSRVISDRGPVRLAPSPTGDALASAQSTLRLACIALRTLHTRDVVLTRAAQEANAELGLLLKRHGVDLPDPNTGRVR